VSFDDAPLREITYEEAGSMQVVKQFVNHREEFLEELFRDTPSLFEE
jgi:predicted ATPase